MHSSFLPDEYCECVHGVCGYGPEEQPSFDGDAHEAAHTNT